MNRLPSSPPSIAELTAGFLRRTEDAEVLAAAADALGDVEPHEVSVGYRAEPRLAWKESLEVLSAFGRKVAAIPAPAEWGGLVARQDGSAALPFVLGNYPQRVRDLGTLLQASDLASLLVQPSANTPLSNGLLKWGTKHIEAGDLPQALVAAANYRAAGDFGRAAETLSQLKGQIGEDWSVILANEEAGVLWHRGQFAEAAQVWAKLPDSVPVRFNRGMAALFLGQAAEARGHLQAAVAGLPESSAWHHLASLYLTLAEMRV
jgi:tetratricopeptide (TPR) repeat protein